MFGDEVFLWPETGTRFTQALKYAALFSSKIWCLSAIPISEVERLLAEQAISGGHYGARYISALQNHYSDLHLLASEGLLAAIDDPEDDTQDSFSFDDFAASVMFAYEMFLSVEGQTTNAARHLRAALEQCIANSPPSMWHLIYEMLGSTELTPTELDTPSKLKEYDTALQHFSLKVFLQLLTSWCDVLRIPLLTTSTSFETAIRAAKAHPNVVITDRPKPDSDSRGMGDLTILMSRQLLSRALPKIDDLPMADVLDLRYKSRDELLAFNTGVRNLVGELGSSMDQLASQEVVDILISTRIDPALNELRAAVKNARLDALSRVGRSWESLGTSTVAAIATWAAGGGVVGVPPAIVALLAPFVGALMQGELEKRKILNSSQWSLLLRLEEH
jgi:hypothetical protein